MNYIHPTAVIGPNVEMGDNNYIGPFCLIGYPAEHKDFWPGGVIQTDMRDIIINPSAEGITGKVIIGNNCKLTGLVTVDAGTTLPTVIRDGVWILKHGHIGHDAMIKDNVVISCGAKIGGHCEIGEGSNIGLNATVHQRVIIPEGCMIGMGTVVTKKTELKPFRKYAGVPAKDIGENKR
jgi:UDP-N-acetylglucosamine acyltransferase